MVAIQIEAQASIDRFKKTDCIHIYCNVAYAHISNAFVSLDGIPGVHQAVSVTSEGSLLS